MANLTDVPSVFEAFELFETPKSAEKLFFEKEIFLLTLECCGRRMERSGQNFCCGVRKCRRRVSARANTFFSKMKLDLSTVLMYLYMFITKNTQDSSFADAAVFSDVTIEEPGVVVEINESKFGKNKYHRGHSVQGAWVLGGVKLTTQKKMCAKVVEKRDGETLIDVITKHVIKGSIIHTDCWKGYSKLKNHGYMHKKVNHKKHFKDRKTGVHNNTIEGTWNRIKQTIPPRNRNKKLDGDDPCEELDGNFNCIDPSDPEAESGSESKRSQVSSPENKKRKL